VLRRVCQLWWEGRRWVYWQEWGLAAVQRACRECGERFILNLRVVWASNPSGIEQKSHKEEMFYVNVDLDILAVTLAFVSRSLSKTS
jgi:hypothetical protein